MTITEKTAYLKGLLAGLDLKEDSKESKIIGAIVETLDEIALSVSDLESDLTELSDQVDEIDEDLGEVEEEVFGCCDGDCCDCDDEDEDEECCYEIQCPNCEETICLSEGAIDQGKMECPHCGELLEFTFEDDEEDACECGCCHHDDEEKAGE